MEKIFPIIIILVIIGAAVFFWHTGFVQKIASSHLSGPGFLNLAPHIRVFGAPSSTVSSTSTTVPKSTSSPGNKTATPPPPAPYVAPAIPTSSIPQGFTRSNLSRYFGEVKISSAYAGSGYPGSYGQIMIYTQITTGTIDVTDWVLKGNRGNEYIPQAINIYDPSGLTAPTDIRFRSGDSLAIYSTTSAIHENLHLNKCIGYITNAAKFNPSLYASCPAPSQEVDISTFSGQCQNYIQSLGNCMVPASNPPVPQYDSACQEFLTTVNYKGCFDRHRLDSDFLSNQWIVWTGSNFLDPYHDRILLVDKQGLLVDLYKY